jgi:hypothetical protein
MSGKHLHRPEREEFDGRRVDVTRCVSCGRFIHRVRALVDRAEHWRAFPRRPR